MFNLELKVTLEDAGDQEVIFQNQTDSPYVARAFLRLFDNKVKPLLYAHARLIKANVSSDNRYLTMDDINALCRQQDV